MSQIILASQSPRRKELLEQIGLEFEICPAKGEEIITKTILLDKKMSDMVNLETDIIAKYIRRFTSPPKEEKNSRLTLSFLQENGF